VFHVWRRSQATTRQPRTATRQATKNGAKTTNNTSGMGIMTRTTSLRRDGMDAEAAGAVFQLGIVKDLFDVAAVAVTHAVHHDVD
jgi:LytS/YehU family sensor histidine kinase